MLAVPPRFRFHVGEDPDINEMLRIHWRERDRACLARFAQRGMDVHDLLQYDGYYKDPDHQEATDVVKRLAAGLHLATIEGLHRVRGLAGTHPAWVGIVGTLARNAEPEDIPKCLALLRTAGVEFATYDPLDDEDPLIGFEILDHLGKMVNLQRIEREVAVLQTTLTRVAEETAGTVDGRARRRL